MLWLPLLLRVAQVDLAVVAMDLVSFQALWYHVYIHYSYKYLTANPYNEIEDNTLITLEYNDLGFIMN